LVSKSVPLTSPFFLLFKKSKTLILFVFMKK